MHYKHDYSRRGDVVTSKPVYAHPRESALRRVAPARGKTRCSGQRVKYRTLSDRIRARTDRGTEDNPPPSFRGVRRHSGAPPRSALRPGRAARRRRGTTWLIQFRGGCDRKDIFPTPTTILTTGFNEAFTNYETFSPTVLVGNSLFIRIRSLPNCKTSTVMPAVIGREI